MLTKELISISTIDFLSAEDAFRFKSERSDSSPLCGLLEEEEVELKLDRNLFGLFSWLPADRNLEAAINEHKTELYIYAFDRCRDRNQRSIGEEIAGEIKEAFTQKLYTKDTVLDIYPLTHLKYRVVVAGDRDKQAYWFFLHLDPFTLSLPARATLIKKASNYIYEIVLANNRSK